jgi:hypothetical protein
MDTEAAPSPSNQADGVQAETERLEALSTEELRERAFAKARRHHDIAFFWSLFKHLPAADDAESLDGSLGTIGASVNDAIALFREFTGHDYGDAEPLLRAAFVDYLGAGDEPATR